MMARLLTTLALLCLATYALGAVTFYLNEGTKKCFIEDLPKDTLVVAAYRAADIDSAKWAPDGVSRRGLTEVIGIKVHCTGPTQEVVAQRVTGEVGKVAFTSKHAGEHEICFQSNSTRWFGSGSLVRTAQCTAATRSPVLCTLTLSCRPQKVELDLQTGAEATDYEDLAQAEHLSRTNRLGARLHTHTHILAGGHSLTVVVAS